MLSNQLADLLRLKLENYTRGIVEDREVEELRPLLNIQERWSAIPVKGTLLIEHFSSREGNHLCIYPFAGRAVHEVLASLFAWRISRIEPISFSMAFNDYGMEFLSDKNIPVEEALELDLFSTENLWQDIKESINSVEMAKRRFREIAAISGLVFQGFPGKNITARHLQASAQMIYDVFAEYDPGNLLLKQATEEVISQQFEQSRLSGIMEELQQQKIVLTNPPKPTPFAFPLLVDRLRERLSSESLQDRIQKMQAQLEAYAANH
jgi:ATP-dependent helicase Lhr and Lhr-like helicase